MASCVACPRHRKRYLLLISVSSDTRQLSLVASKFCNKVVCKQQEALHKGY